eukprot:m.197183 g.197183  ORF g.197183 m.197183 type:complete len:261 (-) comp20032_c0_seq1:220-1002(-)
MGTGSSRAVKRESRVAKQTNNATEQRAVEAPPTPARVSPARNTLLEPESDNETVSTDAMDAVALLTKRFHSLHPEFVNGEYVITFSSLCKSVGLSAPSDTMPAEDRGLHDTMYSLFLALRQGTTRSSHDVGDRDPNLCLTLDDFVSGMLQWRAAATGHDGTALIRMCVETAAACDGSRTQDVSTRTIQRMTQQTYGGHVPTNVPSPTDVAAAVVTDGTRPVNRYELCRWLAESLPPDDVGTMQADFMHVFRDLPGDGMLS